MYIKIKNISQNNSFVLLALFFFLLSISNSFGQTDSAKWVLTTNAAVTTTSNISASAQTFGAGLTTTSYNATNGVTAASFDAAVCTPNVDDYYEFIVTTPGCYSFSVSSITFTHISSSAARCFQLKYSINGGAETQIGGNITVNTTATNYTSGAIALSVPIGQNIRFRLYGSTANATRTLAVKNFVVKGTATLGSLVPAVSIAAVPSGTICSGTSVTFTATPTNGGTPSYQWKLNGANVGTNSPTYSSSALANGNTVTCVMTSSLSCASPNTANSNTITMAVNAIPSIPGTISGTSTASPSTAGLVYSIAAVLGATTYTWTLPAGWVITAGNGTISITCTSGILGQGGNISVTAGNSCGTSAASTKAVTVAIPNPHVGCNSCHINHSSPGGSLTAVNGNANLCISCHNPTGSASTYPFANSDKAIPGVSGNSHSWDKLAVNAAYQTNSPTNTQMANRIASGNIICSTCHDQHSQTYVPYLRASNSSDSLCMQCHSARNIGRYLDNTTTNKGSHPVGITYNSADARFLTSPTNAVILINSKVQCSSCHKVHFATSTDGSILRMANNANLCQSCHAYKTVTTTMDHKGMTCVVCHDAHQTGSNNIYLIRDSISTPNSGKKAVVFTSNTSPNNYADATGVYNGVCEVCHTLTDHYTNTSGGTSDSHHVPATQKCTDCHPHNKGFAPQTDCMDCHKSITDKPGVGPTGGRRQIVDNTGNGLGTGGDFKRYSHHFSGSIPTVADCIRCHYMGDHKDGQVKLLDPDQGYLNVYTYDSLNKAGMESFCLNCHDANGARGYVKPFSDSITVPVINAAMWAASAHKTSSNTCMSCHDNGHGSNKATLLGPANYTGPGTGTDLTNEEEGFCLNCHGASGSALKVHLAFSGTNTTTNFYKHDPSATYRKHTNEETLGSAFGGTNRHIECVDCHNPHGAQSGTATAPNLLPTLIGASGVEPTYAGVGAPTGFAWLETVTKEYQVCYKCHSSFTTLPTYLPGGWNSSAVSADGLKKLTTIGTNSQVGESRDMAQEFNPSSQSFHPVMAAGTNLNINSTTFQSGYTFASMLYCTSCHNSDLSGTAGYGRGPHGSSNLHILDAGTGGSSNYKTVHNNVAAVTTAVCTKCHQAGSYYTGNTGSRYAYHYYHINQQLQSECYVCHDSHGSEQYHLMNMNRNGNTSSCITAITGTSQTAFVHATGTTANLCNVTCHGTSHGAGKSYNPAY